MSHARRVESYSQTQQPHVLESKNLSGKSKMGIVVFSVCGIAGAVFVGLGVAAMFGPLGTTGFWGSMAGGMTVTTLSICGIIWIIVRSKKANPSSPCSTLSDRANIESSKVSPEALLLEHHVVADCQKLYQEGGDAWVMVPTRSDILSGNKPTLGIGSTSYEGAGHFKVHISINPEQMEKAIPIVINTLYSEGMPTVGLKFQTKTMLSGEHQVGKEFALIFSEATELDEGRSHTIKRILTTLHEHFQHDGILPEKGMVLTFETCDAISRLPIGVQSLEKRNLTQRKFDCQIPGSQYFYYRNEDYTAISDDEEWATQMGAQERKLQKIILFSEIDIVVERTPQCSHNPLQFPDPYLDISIG
ncbi:MAG: hypothetical protein S4CHLAM123_14630 [Chlamydiales bacterium]|nr:hypothetical protein [Chlamydiales bacterium]